MGGGNSFNMFVNLAERASDNTRPSGYVYLSHRFNNQINKQPVMVTFTGYIAKEGIDGVSDSVCVCACMCACVYVCVRDRRETEILVP